MTRFTVPLRSFRKVALMLGGWLASPIVFGAPPAVITSPPVEITACGAPVPIEVTLNGGDIAMADPELAVSMTPPLSYVLGSASVDANGGAISELDVSDRTHPRFTVQQVAAGTQVRVNLLAELRCATSALGSLIVRSTLTDPETNTSVSDSGSPTIGTVRLPVIELNDLRIDPQPLSILSGGTAVRTITLKNTGTGAVQHGLQLTDSHGAAISLLGIRLRDSLGQWQSLQQNGTNAYGSWQSGLTDTISVTAAQLAALGFRTADDQSGELAVDAQLLIEETMRLDPCDTSEDDSTLSAQWLCSSSELCAAPAYSTDVAVVNRLPSVPRLTLGSTKNPNTCYANPGWDGQTLTITNSGDGVAFDLKLHTRMPSPSRSYFDPSSFAISSDGGASYSPLAPVSETCPGTDFSPPTQCLSNEHDPVLAYCLNFESSGPSPASSLPQTLAPGETVLIRWNTKTCCPGADGYSQAPELLEQFRQLFDLRYENACQQAQPPVNLDLRAGTQWVSSEFVDGTRDMYDGETQTLQFDATLQPTVVWDSNATTRRFKATFEIDRGLTWTGSPAELEVRLKDGSTLSPLSFNYMPGTATDPSRLEVIYPYSGTPPFDGAEAKLTVTASCPAPGMSVVKHRVAFEPDASCPECVVPYLAQDFSIQVHCAGCSRQGIHFDSYKIERITMGEPDNDDDGKHEAGEPAFDGRERRDRAMRGDLLRATVRGHVEINENYLPWPFGRPLAHGYFESVIAYGQKLAAGPVQVTIQRDDDSYVCTSTASEHDAARSTDRKTFFYDYSPSTLASVPGRCQPSLPANFDRFQDGDQVTIVAEYRLDDNVGRQPARSDVDNWLYLTESPTDPASGHPIDVSHQPPEGCTCDPSVSANDCDSCHRWYCTRRGGVFYPIGYEQYFYNNTNSGRASCEASPNAMIYGFYVGSATKQSFPHEFRSWVEPQQLRFGKAGGFEYGNFKVRMQRLVPTKVDQLVPATPLETATHLEFDVAGLLDSQVIEEVDETFQVFAEVDATRTCAAQEEPNTTASSSIPGLRFAPSSNEYQLEIDAGLDGEPESLHFGDHTYSFYENRLTLSSQLPIIDGFDQTACFGVDLQTSNGPAFNAFLAPDAIPGGMTVKIEGDGSGGVHPLGTAPRSNIPVCATYQCNSAEPSAQTFRLLAGANCVTPANLSDYPCIPAATNLTIQPRPSTLLFSLNQPGGAEPPSLCDSVEYVLTVTNPHAGTLRDILVEAHLPAAIEFDDPSSLVYGGVSTSLPGQPNCGGAGGRFCSWRISDNDPAVDAVSLSASIDSAGLSSASSTEDGFFELRFRLKSACGFRKKSTVSFTASGRTNCQEVVTKRLESAPIVPANTPVFSIDQMTLTAEPFAACTAGPATTPVTVLIERSGEAAADNTVRLQLPPDLYYVSGSFTPLQNAAAMTMIGSGGSLLEWDLPTSASPVEFRVEVGRNQSACGPFSLSSEIESLGTASCEGVSCTVSELTGSAATTLAVRPVDPDFELPASVCVGAPVEVSGPSCVENSWDFGDGAAAIQAAAAQHTYSEPGTYSVTHSLADHCSTSSASRILQVIDCNQPPLCAVSAVQVIGCQSQRWTVKLDGSGSTDPDGDPLTFGWSSSCVAPSISPPNTVSPILSFAGACLASCNVTLTVSDGEASSSCSTTIDVRDTIGPEFLVQPSLTQGGHHAYLHPPNQGYVDFTVAHTGSLAVDACAGVRYQFSSCYSSQMEDDPACQGDGTSYRDCVFEGERLSLRSERNSQCSVAGRSYKMKLDAIDSCGNRTTSADFSACVWQHQNPAPPSDGKVYAPTAGSGQNDTRSGINGTYNSDRCGRGCAGLCQSGSQHDADRDGIEDCRDNCRERENRNQWDRDDDHVGDQCDQDDRLINNLWIDRQSIVRWDHEANVFGYHVYRGNATSVNALANDMTCRATVTEAFYACVERPDPGRGFYFLVTAVTADGEGSPGYSSDHIERQIQNACP